MRKLKGVGFRQHRHSWHGDLHVVCPQLLQRIRIPVLVSLVPDLFELLKVTDIGFVGWRGCRWRCPFCLHGNGCLQRFAFLKNLSEGACGDVAKHFGVRAFFPRVLLLLSPDEAPSVPFGNLFRDL